MKLHYLALIIPAVFSFSSVAGDANFTTDRMQKPVIEQPDMNQMLQSKPSAAGTKKVQAEPAKIKPATSKYGTNNYMDGRSILGGNR